MELLKKYKPTTLNDIISNRIQIKKIKQLLESDSLTVIGIIGPNGCGKTLICQLLFNELNKDVLEVYNKESLNIIGNYMSNKTIESFICNRKKLIFVDNIDALVSTDKISLSILADIKKKYINSMIVLTGNYANEKQLCENFKNNIEFIKINYPSIRDTYLYICDILTKENIKYEDEELLDIITKHRGNIRDILMNLENTNNELNIVKISNTFKDYNIFEISKIIFRKTHSYETLSCINNISDVSYLIYENFPEEIYNNNTTKVISYYIKLNQYYINANILENYMYKTMNWKLFDNIQYLKIMGFNNILEIMPKKKTIKDIKYRYSQLLSKLSHKNIMNKKIKDEVPLMEWIQFSDYIIKKKEKKKYNKEDQNYLNTYDKYFM
jgi:DNA polymerase III gamma/tau subunit